MSTPTKVTAIVGTYRKGGIVDSAVDAILASAKEAGAAVTKVYLIDKDIAFCTNCRTCTQKEGEKRGECPSVDDMRPLLDEIEGSDALVLASPMNFGTVTAVMKRFIERLVCFAYWPWGAGGPKLRLKRKDKRAVIVASSAAPAFMGRFHGGMVKLMKNAAGLLGAKSAGVLFIGLCAMEQRQKIRERTVKKARRLGRKLVSR